VIHPMAADAETSHFFNTSVIFDCVLRDFKIDTPRDAPGVSDQEDGGVGFEIRTAVTAVERNGSG